MILNNFSSNISKKISQLEANIATTLFTRTTRSVQLTEHGVKFLKHSKKILDEGKLLGEIFNEDLPDKEVQGVIRISTPETYANARLVKLLAAFSK
ncbi:LysR family transcriptional regulator [Halobacteriovorax sp.]|uniref:LysR family transcriptional regulator n=1 Tax=Halobacteriovorax sp. TaxID=2020862 RepID=UPI0035625C53